MVGYFMHHDLYLVFGLLALGALLATWRDDRVRKIGWALVVAWALSNVIWFTMDFAWRPLLYPVIDLGIALVGKWVWQRTHYRIAGLVTGLSLLNCMINVGYSVLSVQFGPDLVKFMRHDHTVWTNAIFGTKCIIVMLWGVDNALGWSDRFTGLFRRNRADLHVHARESER